MHFQNGMHTEGTFWPKKYALKNVSWRSPLFGQVKVVLAEPLFWTAEPLFWKKQKAI